MIVIDRLDHLALEQRLPLIATIGSYDALHLGHRAIVSRITARAREIDALSAVISFEPHPLRILAPDRAPRLLLTRDQRIAQLEALGLDRLVLIPFDRKMAQMDAEPFVREVLVERLAVREILVGPDFRFGRARGGDLALLQRLGGPLGLAAEAIEVVLDRGERISASRVRHELEFGNVGEAERLLGRPFALAGTIVHGAGRGGKILVPTANLAPENEFLPARGVYITRFVRAEERIPGLTNVGLRPTFGDTRLTIETFLPGFASDLYGQRVELEFLERLRDERRFETPAELMAQIQQDLAAFETWQARQR